MMLSHVGKTEIADTIKNAWLTTLEKGYHTIDMYQEAISKELVSTNEFASRVIENLGNQPTTLPISNLAAGNGEILIPEYVRKEQKQVLVGVDVFINWKGTDANIIGDVLSGIDSFKMKLKMITNRGVKVYPEGMKETYCTDHWRCRFVDIHSKIEGSLVYNPVDFEKIIALLSKLNNEGFQVIKIENLYEFDGKRGFSLGQGE
jgi:isocitrate dehydrogenase